MTPQITAHSLHSLERSLKGFIDWRDITADVICRVVSVRNTSLICSDDKRKKINGKNQAHVVSLPAWQKATNNNKQAPSPPLPSYWMHGMKVVCFEQSRTMSGGLPWPWPWLAVCWWAEPTPAPWAVQAIKARSRSSVHGGPCSAKQCRNSLGLSVCM